MPFDPISIGIGAVSAARNSSEDSKHNAVYLAVRRLLMALPDNTVLASLNPAVEETVDTVSVIDEPLRLWDEGKQEQALSLAESAYQSENKAEIGYQYGLMLEASENNIQAAEVYSETAIIQLENDLLESALRTLRRLDRLNETNSGQFDSQLSKALEFVQRR